MSDDNREAAIKAVRHELNEVEALTEYSERGACEICEAVVRVVLEAMAPTGEHPSVTAFGDAVAAAYAPLRATRPQPWRDELVRWAETYGHPEEWAQKAKAAHARAEHAEQELKDVKHAYEREVELADRRAAELDALIAAANTAIARNSLGNIQAWLDACGSRASR
jgi:hypothetical protein